MYFPPDCWAAACCCGCSATTGCWGATGVGLMSGAAVGVSDAVCCLSEDLLLSWHPTTIARANTIREVRVHFIAGILRARGYVRAKRVRERLPQVPVIGPSGQLT